MELDKNYTLTGEKYNWILSYKSDLKINEKGKEYFSTDTWYFPNIEDALKKYTDERFKPSDTIEKLISIINDLEHTISKLKIVA